MEKENRDKELPHEKSLKFVAENWVKISCWYVGLVFLLLLLSGAMKQIPSEYGSLPFQFDFNELGDFLAGLFAPLAFFVLVVSLHVQSRELRAQIEEIKESVKAQKDSSSTLAIEAFNNFLNGQWEILAHLAMRFQQKVFTNENYSKTLRDKNHQQFIEMILDNIYRCNAQPEREKNNYFKIIADENENSLEFQRRVLDYKIACKQIIDHAEQVDCIADYGAKQRFMLSRAGQLFVAIEQHLQPKFKWPEGEKRK
jgi:hypothetical protein